MNFNDMYIEIYRAKVELIPNVETGNQFDAPLDLDIRPGNLCNLKCRMWVPYQVHNFKKKYTENSELLSPFLVKEQ